MRNPAGVAEELQVVAALHQVGADLGDPVEIARNNGQIVVSGTGIPPQHQKQIHEALDSVPGVVVRFQEPGGVPSGPGASPGPGGTPPETPAIRDSAGSAPSSFQARLEERLGGRPQFERFSSQLLDASDAVMSRAYALRRLAQEFPPDAERQLSAEGRRELLDLGREHVAALARQSGEMDAALSACWLLWAAPRPPARFVWNRRRGSRQRGIVERGTAGRDGSRGSNSVWPLRITRPSARHPSSWRRWRDSEPARSTAGVFCRTMDVRQSR